MPRVAAVSVQDAVAAIVQFGSHFRTEKLPAWSSQIWKEMSTALNDMWTAECVYTNVTKNRRSILDLARKKMNVVVSIIPDHNNNSMLEETIISTLESSDGEVSSESNSITIDQRNLETFDLVLTELEWTEIEPAAIVTDSNKCSVKPKLSLKPGVWTNIISIAMWQQFRMPCAFVFKRADVSLSNDGQNYELKIAGRCKSKKCGNLFNGYAEKHVISKGLIIKVRARDTRDEKHEVVKRPLNGKRRKTAQKDIKYEGAAIWKKREARKYIQPGDVEPPILPRSNVLQQARQEYLNAELSIKKSDSRDLVRIIEEMALKPEYSGIIHSVSSRPFYVFYCAPAQLHAYKEYCRLNRGSNFICIDATGSVVKTLDRSDGTKTGHIFLYSIVIHFDRTTIAINQMLSEQHDTEFIEFWLKRWIRAAAPKPKEAICDYSRALLSALSLAFNNQTVKAYINSCFSQILKPTSDISEKPATRIRVDVAHFIHLICRWKCFKSLRHPAVKEFFVRCLAMMVECTSLSVFEEILILTCAVGLQTHEDAHLVVTEANTAREARKKLENYIAIWGINVDIGIEDPTKDRAKDRPESFELDDLNGPDGCRDNDIIGWIEQRVSRTAATLIPGQELNPFYLPDFIKNMSRLRREFPLWTGVGMDYGNQRATSSYVEAYFNDIKNRVFKNISRPIRVDKFIKIHARDIAGVTSLFSSKLIQFNIDRCEDPCAQQKISKKIPNNIEAQFVSQNIADSSSAHIGNLGGESQSIDAINFHDPDSIAFENQSRQNNGPVIADSVCMPIQIENNGELDITQNDSDLMSTENWRGKAKPIKVIEPDSITTEDPSENVLNIHISNPVTSIDEDPEFITIRSQYQKTTAPSVDDLNSYELRLEQSCELDSNIDLPCSTRLGNAINFHDPDSIAFENQPRQNNGPVIADSVCMPIQIENSGELDITPNDSDCMSTENWRGKAKPIKVIEPESITTEDSSENVLNIHISNPVTSIDEDPEFITIRSQYQKTTAPSVDDLNSYELRLEQSCELDSNIDLPCSTRLGNAINFHDPDSIAFENQPRQNNGPVIADSVCMPIQIENSGELDITPNDSDCMSTENWRGKAKPIKVIEPESITTEDSSENVLNIHISNPVTSIDKDPEFITIRSQYQKTTAPSVDDLNSYELRLEQSCELDSNIDLPCSTRVEDEFEINTDQALTDHSYSKIAGLPTFENMVGDVSFDQIDASQTIGTNVTAEEELKSLEEILQTGDESDAAYTKATMEYHHNTSVEEDNACLKMDTKPCALKALEPKIFTETDKAELKLTKISKYFRPYPEVRQMNVLQTKKKTSLLANGLHCPAVKINKQSFFVHRTCSFDSFVQLLLTGALDHPEYSTFIENSTNKTLQLVWHLIQSGVTQKTYSERTVILKQFCPIKVQMSTEKRILSYMVDAELSIAHLVEEVMKSEPSVENIEECPNSGRRVYPCMLLAPNHKTIGKYGFKSLEKGLEFQSPIYNIRCRDPCPGKYTLFRQLNYHIFIELDIRPNLQVTCGLRCMLQQIPTILHLKQNPIVYEYRLVGVVAYTPGHYSAYCLRTSGRWEFYNDVLPDMRTCSSDTNIEPHLAVYIRTNNR